MTCRQSRPPRNRNDAIEMVGVEVEDGKIRESAKLGRKITDDIGLSSMLATALMEESEGEGTQKTPLLLNGQHFKI